MQIVIDIPEGNYKTICETKDLWETEPKNIIYAAIANGTPLPKGHGRLIDADEIEHYMLPSEKQDEKTWFVHSGEYKNAVLNFNHAMRLLKDNAPTIIEADAESEGK